MRVWAVFEEIYEYKYGYSVTMCGLFDSKRKAKEAIIRLEKADTEWRNILREDGMEHLYSKPRFLVEEHFVQ